MIADKRPGHARTKIVVAGPVPPIPGGIAQHTANMIEGLRLTGSNVRAISWRSQYPRRIYPGTLPDPTVPFSEDVDPTLHWARPWTWRKAGRIARGTDLLVVPWVTPVQTPVIRTMIAAANPTPTVALVHNASPHEARRLDPALTRWALRHVAGAVAHSASVADEIQRLLDLESVEIVPHPPNLAIDAQPLPAYPPLRCLFFGMVRPYKGLDVALSALRWASDEGASLRLTVAGEFWEPVDRYRRIIAELNLSQQVDLQPGYVPDARLDQLLAAHHFVIAPYRSASQSGIIPIALAAGRPVVTTRIEGLTQDISEGVNGLVANPNDVADLGQRLIEMESALPRLYRGACESADAKWESVGMAVLRAASLD